MIKRYDQFIKNKTNEEFVFDKVPTFGGTFGGTETAPTKPEVAPGTTEKPSEKPGIPSPIRRERTSPIPAPAKANYEEEEEGSDLYTNKIQELADLLGVEAENGYVVYNGKKIMFPSETEKYQIEGVKKGFSTAEEVVTELEKDSTPNIEDTDVEDRALETEEEITSLKDDESIEEIEEFESKSYKNSRLKKVK